MGKKTQGDEQTVRGTICEDPSETNSTEGRTWTDEEERHARRKIDRSILPLLCLGFMVFQLDRLNLASALTAGFADYINIDHDTINLGNQLLFLGTISLEIPSNMLLQKVGPRTWISSQVMVFGFVGIMQILIRNRAGYLASRLCLGLAECGYIPGSMFVISAWYTPGERAKRIAIFFFGLFGGNAISPLFASGILKIGNKYGLKGFQWLFLIEGLLTLVIAVLFFCLLPESPRLTRPLLGPGLVRFSKKDEEVLQDRIDLRRVKTRRTAKGTHIPLRIVWKTIKHWQRWAHFVSTFCVFSTWSPLTTYTPSIIMSLGFERITANALAAVGGVLALPVIFIFGSLSDYTNRRGLTVIVAQFCYLVSLVILVAVHPTADRWSRWGLWTVVNTFAVGYHPVHNTWLQLNCHSAEDTSIGIAMWVTSANAGLMAGAWYYRGDDGPFYLNGVRTQIAMVSVGVVFAVIQEGIYTCHNRRVAWRKHVSAQDEDAEIYVP